MHNEKFQSAAQDFLRKLHTDTAMNLERWQERRQRRTFYQSFTREKILSMREDDFYEYISRLWAMLIWGNKKYVVDKLIEDNGFETIKRFLADLLFGSKPVHNRWDSFLKEIKGMGPATVSELLCYQDPQNFIIANRTTATCFQYLGIPGMPRRNYQFTGARYLEVCRSAKQLAEALRAAGGKDMDLLMVDYFLWDEILPLAEKNSRRNRKASRTWNAFPQRIPNPCMMKLRRSWLKSAGFSASRAGRR